MSVHEKLMKVQSQLKAPKNQFNSFGKYNYRSCEDILEGLKPILAEVGAVVLLSDTVEAIGQRYYVKATATFVDIESNDAYSVNAYAREDEDKKGMDLAQITGSVSSYARKYALNGLFCIDDAKDSDSTNQHGKEQTPPTPIQPRTNTITPTQQKKIFAEAADRGVTAEAVRALIYKLYGGKIKSTSELTPAQMDELLKEFPEKKEAVVNE